MCAFADHAVHGLYQWYHVCGREKLLGVEEAAHHVMPHRCIVFSAGLREATLIVCIVC